MKFKHLFFILVAGFFAVSCSSDNDNTPSPSQSAAGTYKGYVIADSQYFKGNITQNETITITANEDGAATVVYTSSSSNWGTSTISAAVVTATTNGYSISGTGTSAMSMSGTTNSYDCTLTGTISADKSDVELIFVLPDVMGGTTIKFCLGDAPDTMVIAGAYTGTIDMSVMGASQGNYDNIKVTIKAQEDGNVEITLPPFGEGAMAFTEDVVMKDIKLTVEDGTYTLSGDVNTTSATTRPIEVTGSLAGTIKDGKADIIFSLIPGAMPMPLVLTFASK